MRNGAPTDAVRKRSDADMADNDLPTPNPDHAWKTLTLVNDWIKHADAKIAVTLAVTAASALTLFNIVKSEGDCNALFKTLSATTGLVLLITALFASGAIVPRVTIVKKKEPEKFDNLLFYRHIARGYSGRKSAYALALANLTMDEQALTRHIADQVHANSTVVDRKYKWADRAIRTLSLALVLLVATAAIAFWD